MDGEVHDDMNCSGMLRIHLNGCFKDQISCVTCEQTPASQLTDTLISDQHKAASQHIWLEYLDVKVLFRVKETNEV